MSPRDLSRPRLTVIGAGPMARALGRIVQAAGGVPTLFVRSHEARAALREALPEASLPEELGEAVREAEIVFLAVPAAELLEAAEAFGEHARGDHSVITVSRGVGEGFMLPHEMVRARTCVRKIGVLGGPLHARELLSGRQINAVVASRYREVVAGLRAATRGAPVSIHASKDLAGVQIAGAISNVAFLAAGMADALELGDTARGVLLAHGLVDAKTLALALGGSEATFSGLAGLGELIPRHVTSMDRHVEVGARIGAGLSAEAAQAEAAGHLEGILTAREAMKRAEALGLELRLVRAVAAVLDGAIAPREALEAVLRTSLDLEGRGAPLP